METLFFRVAAVSAAVSVVLLPLLLVSRWRKRYAPHTRRAVWLVIAAVLLAAPLLPKSRAPVQITVPERAVILPAAVPAAPQSGTAPVQAAVAETVLPEMPVSTVVDPALAESPAARTVEWGALFAALWLTGGAAVLLGQGVAYLLARRRVMRSAVPCTGYEELAAELCPRRSVRFFRVDGVQTPMTLGAFRPAVLLPRGEVRQAAVRHELIHVRRRDVAWKTLLLLACAVHWFNPLVWLLSRRADRDMEASCDAAVLAGGDAAERRAYGELLLETAAGRNIPLTTRFGGGKKLMKERLYDLFHPGKKSRVLVAAVLLLCLTAGSLVVCKGAENGSDAEADVSALDGQAAQEESGPDEDGDAAGYELHQVVLPSSEREKNGYNAEIFAIDPFAVNLYLPAGWTVREAAAMRQEGEETYPAVDGLFSVQCILDETGRPVGSLGYNLAPACEDGTDNPMALFAGITIAKYRFDVWETYDPVVETGGLTVALTDVVQEYSHPEGIEAACNRGLLLRDENFGVYVAIELDSGVLTDEQILDIAGHLSLSAVGAASTEYMLQNGIVYIRQAGDAAWKPWSDPIPAPASWAGSGLDTRREAETLVDCEYWIGMTSSDDGWLVASVGQGVGMADTYVYRTQDAGRTWEETGRPEEATWYPACAAFLDDDRAILGIGAHNGAPVYMTEDGGETWAELELPLPEDGLTYEAAYIVFYGASGVITLHRENGYTAVTTDDYGKTWHQSSALLAIEEDGSPAYLPFAPEILPTEIYDDHLHDNDPIRFLGEVPEKGIKLYGLTWASVGIGGTLLTVEQEGEPAVLHYDLEIAPSAMEVYDYDHDGSEELVVEATDDASGKSATYLFALDEASFGEMRQVK